MYRRIVKRQIAKQIAKGDWQNFIKNAPEDSYEEVNVKGFVIGYVKADWELLLPYIAEHIEKIDDWSLCDGFCSNLKIVAKHREQFLEFFDLCEDRR